jgi:hypothetical protein
MKMKANLHVVHEKITLLQEEIWGIERFPDSKTISAVRFFAIITTEYEDRNNNNEFDCEHEFAALQDGIILPMNTQHKDFIGFIWGKVTEEKIQTLLDSTSHADLDSTIGGFMDFHIDKDGKVKYDILKANKR